MVSRAPSRFKVVCAVLAVGAAIPILAPVLAQQGGPESLLPEGFGDPVPAEQPSAPSSPRPQPGQTAPSTTTSAAVDAGAAALEAADGLTANSADNAAELAEKYDLPPTARRSLSQVGPLTPKTGGLDPDAFGAMRGQALAGLMRASHAPFVSRWASINLRRALLSGVQTPSGINGADFVAERAWLLLRMGDADSARLLVQNVDSDQYTARLYAVAMQAFLASADPAGLCPLLPRATGFSRSPSWTMAEAICASFSGDQGTASGILNAAERRGRVRGIDYRLAEKVVGSGPNSRRSVKIEWEGVDRLTAWRFGLATATNVEMPSALYASAGTQVRAWEARAPMLPLIRREQGVAVAGRIGVLSASAMLDFYAMRAADPEAPASVQDRSDLLRTAHIGDTIRARVDAMRTYWSTAQTGDVPDYTRLIPLARAAAAIPPTDAVGDDAPWLIAAMLAGGYDRNAQAWSEAVGRIDGASGERAWALLAVGAPRATVDMSSGRVQQFVGADDRDDSLRGRMLVAALAGLGRLGGDDRAEILAEAGIVTAPRTRWAQAIEAAAQRGEKGSVVLLAAVGLQGRSWSSVSAQHMFHITAALRQVGLEPQARMIAAEAVARL